MIVTIDGVAASGKSSVSSGVARALGIPYLSSGLLYRALTFLQLSQISQAKPSTESLLELLNSSQVSQLRLEPLADGNHLWLAEQNITPQLHANEIDLAVSTVASVPAVRQWVDDTLRQVSPPFVAEGRDMGSVVFPAAYAKFYLTASPRVRALRRAPEREGGGLDRERVSAIEAALVERDQLDQQNIAPATDAQIIQTDHLNLEQVIGKVLGQIEAKRDQALRWLPTDN